MNPVWLKVHGAVVLLSLAIFIVRGAMMIIGRGNYNSRPMVAGASLTMLGIFITGIALVVMLGLDYFGGFVITKLLGLVFYVVVGIMALRPGQSKIVSILLWLVALSIFAYTVMVARHLVAPLF
ncbi:MAG: SirB2 family protein [bacterium]